jgi:V/A-type H+/Na+-transporting ATPase subunit I
MLRSERMTSASIFCVARDVELALEALSGFGEFHVEQSSETVSVAEFNQNIQRIEEVLAEVNDLTKQLISETPGLLDIFRVEQPTKNKVTSENWRTLQEATVQQISALKKDVDALNASLSSLETKTGQLVHLKNMLTIMQAMGADLAAMEELRLVHIETASVPHKNRPYLEAALADYPVIIHRCYLTKNIDFMRFAMPSKYRVEIEKILKTHHSEIFQIPQELPHDVPLALKEVNNQLKQTSHQEKQGLSQIRKLGKENHNKLISWKETVENILAMLRAERKILQSGRLAHIKGFVPQKRFDALSQKINSDLEGKALVLENEPVPEADPPTMVSHNRFVKPFEEITKLYGLPHYDELDPTPIVAITFPLIFGLMFGDIGHGLLLLIGGVTLGTLIKKGQAIKNVCWILAACGVGAIIAGILFGEFFGIEVFKPLWFSPFPPLSGSQTATTDNVLMFLIFSLFVGVIQISSGLVLELVDFLFRHNVLDAVVTSVPKIAFYVGAVYLVAVYKLDFAAWFRGPILLAVVPFIVLVSAKPIALVFTRFSNGGSNNEENSFVQRVFESGDLVTRLLSNTISYSRILALLMAHWALILVVYTVAGLIGSASILTLILSGIIIVAGNIFVLALEGLIVFIHTMRLHFYEWFSKFYLGTGTPFTPFKQKSVYTEVELTKKHA